jgi:hypothetical protein
MSKKGGYLIIDLENINITAPVQTQKLDLSYNLIELLEHNYYKHTIVSGIVINGVEYNDFITNVVKKSAYFTFYVYGFSVVAYIESGEVNVTFKSTYNSYNGRFGSDKKSIIHYIDFPYTRNLFISTTLGGTSIALPINIVTGIGKFLVGQITIDTTTYNFYITANSSNDWIIECDNATSSQVFTLYYVGY